MKNNCPPREREFAHYERRSKKTQLLWKSVCSGLEAPRRRDLRNESLYNNNMEIDLLLLTNVHTSKSVESLPGYGIPSINT